MKLLFTPTSFRHTKRLRITVSKSFHEKFHFNLSVIKIHNHFLEYLPHLVENEGSYAAACTEPLDSPDWSISPACDWLSRHSGSSGWVARISARRMMVAYEFQTLSDWWVRIPVWDLNRTAAVDWAMNGSSDSTLRRLDTDWSKRSLLGFDSVLDCTPFCDWSLDPAARCDWLAGQLFFRNGFCMDL